MKKLLFSITVLCLLTCVPNYVSAQSKPDIDCAASPDPTFKSNETPNKNRRNPKDEMIWRVIGEKHGWVVIHFERKGANTVGSSPLDNGEPTLVFSLNSTSQDFYGGKIHPDAQGSDDRQYTYKISCFKSDGTALTPIDPIIEVPKVRVMEEKTGSD